MQLRTLLNIPGLLAVFFILTTISCGKDDPEPASNTGVGTMSLPTNALKGYELAIITVTDFSLIENMYELELGNTKVKARVGENNSLSFLIPGNLQTGEYVLKSSFAKNAITVSITAPVTIADPEIYFLEYTEELYQDFLATSDRYDEQVADGQLTAEEAAALKTIAQQALNAISTYSADLTKVEKVIYFQLIEANKNWVEEYQATRKDYPYTNGRGKESTDPCASLREQRAQLGSYQTDEINQVDMQIRQCEADAAAARLNASNAYLGKLSAAFQTAKDDFSNTPGFLKASKAFIKTFFSEAATGIWEEYKRANNISDDPFGVKSLDDANNSRIKATEFIAEKEYGLGATITLSNLSSENDKLLPGLVPLKSSIDTFNKFLTVLNEVIDVVPLITLPAYAEKQLTVSGFTIDNISDPKVIMTVANGGKGKVVKLTATGKPGDKIPFTFRMKVNSKYGSVEKVINATVKIPSMAIGEPYQGGIIANILKPGDVGYEEGKDHGLIAAPYDQAVVTACDDKGNCTGGADWYTAIKLCDELVLGGYDDWHLPTKDELDLVFVRQAMIGNFITNIRTHPNTDYWTATEYSPEGAWRQSFFNGYQWNFRGEKTNHFNVRAVRKF